jgi:curved DNA-binding protein
MQFRDYYATLEVPRTATADEIKKSYRRLSKKYHPDVNVGSAASEAKFKEIGEAYEVLKDPEKRKRYDRMGHDPGGDFGGAGGPFGGAGGGGPFGGGNPFGGAGWQNVDWNARGAESGFSDFFDTFFGQQPQQPRPRRRPPPRGAAAPSAGVDRDVELPISLEDALTGTTRAVTLQQPVTTADGGRRLDERVLNVKVPANARDGMKIRLKGEGERGVAGGPAGDLFLVVRFAPHARFTVVDGVDLQARLIVSPWEAAFGAKVPFATLDGEVKLTVPPSTTTGSKLRLKARGLPKKDGERGNITVEIVVVTPTNLSADETALLAQWQKLRDGWDPRA